MNPNTSTADPPRRTPQAPELERGLLSMAFIDSVGVIDKCLEAGVNMEFFYIPAYQIIWQALRNRHEKGEPINAALIAQDLADRNQLEAVGGHAGMMDIAASETTTALLDSYLKELKDKATLRRFIQTHEKLIATAYTSPENVDAILDRAEADTMAIRDGAAKASAWSIKDAVNKNIADIERKINHPGELIGLSTGFPELDRLTDGLKQGELFIIAARPGMGKTSFLLNMAEHFVMKLKQPMAIFSLEMPSHQLTERLLYARAGINARAMAARGSINHEEMRRLKYAMKEIRNCPLTIDDRGELTISELRAKARRIQREHPELCCIGIDYLQLMHSTSKQAQGSREREISEISAGLKALAKELKLPVIALAQLNRAAETRAGENKGKPALCDLRDSGSIEQDADMVGFIYRPGKYADDEESKRSSEAYLLLEKNRSGSTGSIPLYFNAALTKFTPATPPTA